VKSARFGCASIDPGCRSRGRRWALSQGRPPPFVTARQITRSSLTGGAVIGSPTDRLRARACAS
jgi:hypothetical protein